MQLEARSVARDTTPVEHAATVSKLDRGDEATAKAPVELVSEQLAAARHGDFVQTSERTNTIKFKELSASHRASLPRSSPLAHASPAAIESNRRFTAPVALGATRDASHELFASLDRPDRPRW